MKAALPSCAGAAAQPDPGSTDLTALLPLPVLSLGLRPDLCLEHVRCEGHVAAPSYTILTESAQRGCWLELPPRAPGREERQAEAQSPTSTLGSC